MRKLATGYIDYSYRQFIPVVMEDGVDFVNPMFLWISPIENKVEERRKELGSVSRNSPTHPHSPLLKAKTALQRRFSGGNTSDLHETRVNEALDACIWLKSAGFPQYVQKFEAGEFPLNLSKLQVERDHSFLDGPAIETLVKRLNVLNRCAYLLEEILEKSNDSDDEDDMRALSEKWQFQRGEGRWSRMSAFGIDTDTTTASNSESESHRREGGNPSLFVTELTTSPTRKGTVKSYRFSLTSNGGDSPVVPSASGLPENDKIESPRLKITSENNESIIEEELDLLGSFASGMLDKFEVTLARLRKGDSLSRSMPNVYTMANGLEVDSLSVENNRLSMTSDTSDKEEFLIDDDYPSPPVHFRQESPEDKEGGVATWGPSPDTTSYDDLTPEDTPSHPTASRRNTMESLESESFHEVFEHQTTQQTTPSQQPIKAKWHSFQRLHSFRHVYKPLRTLIPIEELSVGQILVLRKLSLIKLTALLELHNAKANVSRILKSKKNKQQQSLSSKTTFGGSLASNVLKYGTALPPVIIQAMNHLRISGMDTVGLFRRTAAKASIESLKEQMEINPENVDFSEYTNYQVADAIKLFFRDLPDPLISGKLSEVLLACYENIPEEVRLQALQAVILLLPDENREALHCLLHFLNFVASHSKTHQMDAKNLGLCLSPSLFALSSVPRPALSRRGSFRRANAVNSAQSSNLLAAGNKELNEHMASSRCLTDLIQRYNKVFSVAADMLQVCKFSHLEFGDPVPFHELGKDKDGFGSYQSYVEDCITTMLKDQRKRYRGWVHCHPVKGVGLAYSKVEDGIPLRLWRAITEVPVPPKVLLKKIWDDRYLWDGHVVNARHVARLDSQTEVFQYVTSSIPPLAHRDHCILRSWRYDSMANAYAIVATSISHPNATLMGGIRCTELALRYWIEPTPDGNSQLTFYSRVDLRGRSPDFYNHAFGRYLGTSIFMLRDSFKRSLELECIETPV